MTYENALQIIKNKESLGIMPGLSRIEALLNKMGSPQNRIKIIHVAGTNGKGTISAEIANALQKAGYKVGIFSSPWVNDYREQIMINGEYIPKEKLTDYVGRFAGENVTEFELITAIMYLYFYEENIDFAVIECGMGGKGDATNVVDSPLISVITSVSIDHTAFLGDTVEKIAIEKSYIIKKNSTAVLYPNCETVSDVMRKRCKSVGAKLFEVKESLSYKQNNLNTAQAVLDCLNVKVTAQIPKLSARCERIGDNWMLDGAHNTDGVKALVSELDSDKKITAVIAMMRDKDVSSYVKILSPYISEFVVTTVPNMERAMSVDELKTIVNSHTNNVVSFDNPLNALNYAKQSENFILICGSFYLARYLRKYL